MPGPALDLSEARRRTFIESGDADITDVAFAVIFHAVDANLRAHEGHIERLLIAVECLRDWGISARILEDAPLRENLAR